MPRLVAIRSYPSGPRVWVAGQRLHHGATGCALIASRRPALVLLGLVLCAHDRADWRVWWKREKLPAITLDTAAIHL